jgi:CheY-like chemotaxis protein
MAEIDLCVAGRPEWKPNKWVETVTEALAAPEPLPARSGDAMESQCVKGEIVLVVENQAVIRMNIVHVAEDLGCEVLEATSADEAIEILQCRNDIRAVITDIIMPGSMCGMKLARAIIGRWPPIQVIVTSALDASKNPDLPTYCQFIRKPYENRQITAALQDAFRGQN